MRKLHLLAAVAALTVSGGANAANLISAAVTGGSGTVWNTTQDGFYTLFLQNPGLGDFLNGADPTINFTPTGADNILLAGEGFLPGQTTDSDALYTVTLNFSDGATLTGTYTPVGNQFLGGSSTTVGNTTYTLTDFSWRRFRGDTVTGFTPVPGGDTRDYTGNFDFTAVTAAVPEPATWAMMIGGFGFIGGAMRRRSKVRVAYSA